MFVSSAVAVLDRETFHSMGSVPPPEEDFFVKVQTPCSVRSAVSFCSPVRTVPSSFFQPLKENVPFTPSFEPDTLAGTSATV